MRTYKSNIINKIAIYDSNVNNKMAIHKSNANSKMAVKSTHLLFHKSTASKAI